MRIELMTTKEKKEVKKDFFLKRINKLKKKGRKRRNIE